MRLIDADRLLKSHCLECDMYPSCNTPEECDSGAVVHILLAPTVDAVPVIRCKDCKWYINNILKADGTEDKRFKRSWCEIHRMETNDYGYCHWAYRRKDEGIHSDNREGS